MNQSRKFGRDEYMHFYSYAYAPAHASHASFPIHHFPARQALLATAIVVLILSIGTSGLYWRANRLVVSNPAPSAQAINAEPQPTPAAQAPAVVEQPVTSPPVAPGPDQGLQAILEGWAANHPGYQWSMAVQGISGDQRFASLNTESKMRLASIYKLFLTYPLFQKLPLEQFSQTYLSVGGVSRSVGDCVDAMLRLSDNPCGEAIGAYIGWAQADKVLNAAGFSRTQLNSSSGTQSTTGDTAKLLREIYNGSLYSEQQRQYILNILKQQTHRKGIPAGCPGCEVANKTGELAGINNDAGIIYYVNDVYSLVIFSNGAGYGDIASLTSQIQQYMAG